MAAGSSARSGRGAPGPGGRARRPAAAARTATSRATPAGPASSVRTGATAIGRRLRTGPQTPLEVRRSRFLRRVLVLGSLLVVLAVMLVPTVRSLVRQRAQIAQLESSISADQQQVQALQSADAKWSDPAYVEQQARDRLKLVMPGDKSYSVIDGTSTTGLPAQTLSAGSGASVPAVSGTGSPWYGKVWQSVRLADQPGAGMVPVK